MKALVFILMFVVISCGPKPTPAPTPKPKTMSYKIHGKTYSIKATLTDKAQYEAKDAKKLLMDDLKVLDNK